MDGRKPSIIDCFRLDLWVDDRDRWDHDAIKADRLWYAFTRDLPGYDDWKGASKEVQEEDWRGAVAGCPEWELPKKPNGQYAREVVGLVMDGEVPSVNAGAIRVVDKYGVSSGGASYKKGTVKGASEKAAIRHVSLHACKIMKLLEEKGFFLKNPK